MGDDKGINTDSILEPKIYFRTGYSGYLKINNSLQEAAKDIGWDVHKIKLDDKTYDIEFRPKGAISPEEYLENYNVILGVAQIVFDFINEAEKRDILSNSMYSYTHNILNVSKKEEVKVTFIHADIWSIEIKAIDKLLLEEHFPKKDSKIFWNLTLEAIPLNDDLRTGFWQKLRLSESIINRRKKSKERWEKWFNIVA